LSTSTKQSQALINETLLTWWKNLEDKYRGERAQLRRCRDLSAVMFQPGFHRLRRELLGTDWRYTPAIAAVAGILAHVKENSSLKLVDSMATPKEMGADTPRVSGLRFRRLLQCKRREDLFLNLIRTVRLLDNTANVTDLAKDIYKWGDYTRQQWAFRYYEKAPTAD